MKTRTFKAAANQAVYDHFREHGTTSGFTSLSGAYRRGLLGLPNRNVRTSGSYSAHAAGLDTRIETK